MKQRMSFKYLIIVCCFVLCMETINASFEVILEKIETAFGDKDKVFVFDGLRVKKFNRTSYVISGKYNLKIPLGADIDIFVEALNFQGGQYKKMGEKKLTNFCTSLYFQTYKEIYNNFYEASSMKTPFKTCPFPAGENEVSNFILTDGGILPPYIPGGEKWKIHMRYIKDNEVLGGYNLYILLRNDKTMLKSFK